MESDNREMKTSRKRHAISFSTSLQYVKPDRYLNDRVTMVPQKWSFLLAYFFFFCSFSCNTHIHHWPPTFFYALEPHLECSRVHALIILDKKSEISKRRGDKEEKGRRGKTLLYVHKTGEQEKKRKERKMIENRNDDWKKRMEDYFRYERIAKIWKISKKKTTFVRC